MKSKTEFKYRWLIVILCSLSMSFFSFTSQDLATQHDAYKEYFKDQIDPKDYDFYFNTLYSSALFFIIFMDIYVGAMADKYGPGLLFIIQAISIASGQFVFFIGIRYKLFSLLYIGRFLIYSANSTTLVSNSIMTAQYFMQKEMGLATSVSTTTGVMGVAMNLTFAPRLTNAYGILTTSFVTLCLCCAALIMVFIAYTINKKIDEQIRTDSQIKTVANQNVKAQNFMQQVKSLPKEYWYICNATFLSNVCGTMVGILGPAFLAETYHLNAKDAGSIASMLPIASICVPLIGKLTDYFGKPIIFMIISGFLCTVGCYGLTEWNPTVFYAIFGVSYAIRIAVTVPILTLVVPNNVRGKAYGIQRSLRDVSGFLFTLLCGYLHNLTGSYKVSLYLFSSIGLLVMLFAYLCQRELDKNENEAKERRTVRRNTLTLRKQSISQNNLSSSQLKQLQSIDQQQQNNNNTSKIDNQQHSNASSVTNLHQKQQQHQELDGVKQDEVK